MSKPLSVLQRATRADVRSEPFPHIILRDALPLDLYQELADTFPAPEALEIDTRRNNTRWDYEAHRIRSNEAVPQIWRDFIAYHVSQAFFAEIAELFYDDIHKLYPDYYPNYERLKNMKAGIRFPGFSSTWLEKLKSHSTSKEKRYGRATSRRIKTRMRRNRPG
ncbi:MULTISPECIES: hypothetical protein [unclassified Mesorhizobium]|uniref:hypothetical protein n=1 Tax=unclassified Mesorhizobium TaxID=325217 RepID=UPI003338CEF5